MKQYLIHAWDHTDKDALERRMVARPLHFEVARALKSSGNFIVGGAMLNEKGTMIGSTLILQFKTEAELERWKEHEPYITMGVWDKVDVNAFRIADV